MSLVDAVSSIVEIYPPQWSFPEGDINSLPTESELRVFAVLEQSSLVPREELVPIVTRLNSFNSYNFAIFAIRMAILAVRTGDARPFRLGLVGMVVDEGGIDWRDVIRALSLLEHCASMLGLNLRDEIGPWCEIASCRRKRQIDEYFEEEAGARGIWSMGFITEGAGPSFHFVMRGIETYTRDPETANGAGPNANG